MKFIVFLLSQKKWWLEKKKSKHVFFFCSTEFKYFWMEKSIPIPSKRKKSKKPYISAGALGIPLTVVSVMTRKPRTFYGCLFVHLILCILCTISTFHMLAIAIDKYVTICCRDRLFSSRWALFIILSMFWSYQSILITPVISLCYSVNALCFVTLSSSPLCK